MTIIKHRFLTYEINPDTEILIIGTFNPDAKDNKAEFFYGRGRNFLWRLLPTAFGAENLKDKTKQEKFDFIKKQKIDFIDLISEVEVEEGEETNYEDKYIDSKVTKWCDVIAEIKKLKKIKRICLTRKTLSDIPKMKIRVDEIQKYCVVNNIPFQFLKTPARTYSINKQKIWTDFLIDVN